VDQSQPLPLAWLLIVPVYADLQIWNSLILRQQQNINLVPQKNKPNHHRLVNLVEMCLPDEVGFKRGIVLSRSFLLHLPLLNHTLIPEHGRKALCAHTIATFQNRVVRRCLEHREWTTGPIYM
jgi:hypothetical protein